MTARRFSPGLVPTLATLVTVPILVWLGFWQLHRAAEKRAIEARYAARSHDEEIRLDGRLRTDAPSLRYYNVSVTGYYDAAHQIFVGNHVHDGRLGYEVYTPLRQNGGQVRVLVDRGWLPRPAATGKLPKAPAPTGEITVHGRADVPYHNIFAFKAPPIARGSWPPKWQTLDLKRFASAIGYPLQPFVIRLAPNQPNGYLRHWPAPDLQPERSTGYAIQWFAMAVTVVIIYLVVNFRRAARARSDGDDQPAKGDG